MRLDMPSLSNICEIEFLIVCSVTFSLSEISPFRIPSATSHRICCSRGVSEAIPPVLTHQY